MKSILKFEAVAIVVGTVIGAGVLGLPYVFAQSNFFTALTVLVVVTLAMLMLLLFLGEIALRTPTRHQLTGYVEIYLGKLAKHFLAVVSVLSLYGSLLAYTIGQGEVLAAIFGGSTTLWSIVFYVVFSALVIMGLKTVKSWELILTLAIFAVVVLIGWISAPEIHVPNINGFSFDNIFVVYGVILFACSGIAAVGEVRDMLFGGGREKLMKKTIIWGAILPSIIYVIFSFLVVGVTGAETTPVATVGLGQALGPKMVLVGNIFAFVAMASSFLALGIALREIFTYDYSVSPRTSSILVVAVPIIVFLLGVRGFIEVLSFVGAIGTGLAGILMLFVYWVARTKGKRKPEYKIPGIWAFPASVALIVLFSAGILYVFK